MTTELEKQFFDMFNINQYFDPYLGYTYPQITDEHYLELIVLLSGVCCMNFAFERSLSEMKYKILKITMEYKKVLKHQVQAIFEVEE